MKTAMFPPYVELTTFCNLRCLHCYNESGEEKAILTMDNINAICDTAKKADVTNIALSGGEPMLHPQFTEIVDVIAKRGFNVTVITNATCITDTIMEKLRNTTRDCGTEIHFQVSINGTEAIIHDSLCGVGAFDMTMRGLKCLLTYFVGDETAIHVVLNKNNVSDILKLINFVRGLGIKSLSFSSLNQQGRGETNYSHIALTLEETLDLKSLYDDHEIVLAARGSGMEIKFPFYTNKCPFLYEGSKEEEDIVHLGCRIDPFGNVYLCQAFNDYVLGNINEMSLYDILIANDCPAQRRIQIIRNARKGMEKCKKCVWQKACGTGCPANAVMVSGSIYEDDGYCEIRDDHFLTQLKISAAAVEAVI